MFQPGDVVNNLEIESYLGQGAFGAVYRVLHRDLMERYALKVLHSRELLPGPYDAPRSHQRKARALERFKVEGRIMCRLKQQNIVRTYDLFSYQTTWCIRMEYVDGGTLGEELQAAGDKGLELDRALQLTREVLSGLATIHFTDIVHRDIKPPNILLTRNGCAKIGDFGIAVAPQTLWELSSLYSRRTDTVGPHPGTLIYMSPEQIEGRRDLTPSSDLYTMGVMLYQMLARGGFYIDLHRAEVDDSVSNNKRLSVRRLTKLIVKEPPLALHTFRPDLPDWLDTVILKVLAKDPNERFQSAEEFLDCLSRRQGATIAAAVPSPDPPMVCIESPPDRTTVFESAVDVRGRAERTEQVEMFHPRTGQLLRESVSKDTSFCFRALELRGQTNRITVAATSHPSILHSVLVFYQPPPSENEAEALTRLLASGRWEVGDPGHRCAKALGGLIRKYGLGVMTPLVEEYFNSPDVTIRCNAVVAVSCLANIQRFVESALPANDLRFDDRQRTQAGDFLSEFVEEQALGRLLLAMKYDPAAHVRQEAVHAFRLFQPAVAQLIEVLRHDASFAVREAAGVSLGELGVADAVEDLSRAVERDPSLVVKGSALEALARIGSQAAIPLIHELLDILDPALRVKAQGVVNRLSAGGERNG